MNFKNEATVKSCEAWVKYPFENNHPFKNVRFNEFMLCLCQYEKSIEEDEFLSLMEMPECRRTAEEIQKAFDNYQIIYDFYKYQNKE